MRILGALVLVAGALGAGATAVTAGTDGFEPGPVVAGGAFTCDFGLPLALLSDPTVPGIIERDRIYMSQRPGMIRKHIPFSADPAGARWLSGGRYLFDTARNAAAYLDWVRGEFVLDGIPFLEREEFLDPDCHAWEVAGAHDFADIHTSQTALRTQRWEVPDGVDAGRALRRAWPRIVRQAARRGDASVWLLSSPAERLVSLVTVGARTLPRNPAAPDAGALLRLAAAEPLGGPIDRTGWRKVMDRTQFSFNIWFPFAPGDSGEPSIWPNSPPFPEPYAGDGVCVPSRGENHSTAPQDCTPHCGDGVPDADENTRNCPSDVPL